MAQKSLKKSFCPSFINPWNPFDSSSDSSLASLFSSTSLSSTTLERGYLNSRNK